MADKYTHSTMHTHRKRVCQICFCSTSCPMPIHSHTIMRTINIKISHNLHQHTRDSPQVRRRIVACSQSGHSHPITINATTRHVCSVWNVRPHSLPLPRPTTTVVDTALALSTKDYYYYLHQFDINVEITNY